MHNGSTPSSIPTPPPLPLGGLNNWDPKKNSNTAPPIQKQQNTQSNPQQQPTTEIDHSDKDKIITTQPTLENSSMPISVLKVNISVPKLSIAICLLFTSNISAIGCIVATAILYKAPVVPIVPIAIFTISMLVMFASIIYIVYSIKNALKVDLKEHIEPKQPEKLEKTQQQTVYNPSLAPLAPEENLGNVVNPSEPTPPPIISPESGDASQPPTPSPLISNHSSNGAPPPPPPLPTPNHSSNDAPHLPSNGPSKPGNNMGNGDARCALFSQIQEGVKLKTRKERDELLNQINQTKSDEEKPNSGATLKSINKNTPVEKKAESNVGHELAQTLAKRRSVVSENQGTKLEGVFEKISEMILPPRSRHNSVSSDSTWDSESEDDTSGQSNPQARSQSSTNNKPTKPQVPEKPPGLMKIKPNKAAAPVNASVDQTQVSFVKGRSKFFENQW